MFNVDDSVEDWTLIDRIGVAACCAILLGFALIAPIGPGRGFVTSRAYADANMWVGLACATLCIQCALYVLAQLLPATGTRGTIGAIIVAGCAGYFCALSGVPAVLGESHGALGKAVFEVTEITYGGRHSCPKAIADNPKYQDLSRCLRDFAVRPKVGDRLEVTGKVSDWGIQPKDIRVLP